MDTAGMNCSWMYLDDSLIRSKRMVSDVLSSAGPWQELKWDHLTDKGPFSDSGEHACMHACKACKHL